MPSTFRAPPGTSIMALAMMGSDLAGLASSLFFLMAAAD
jgi:hypothetical protein